MLYWIHLHLLLVCNIVCPSYIFSHYTLEPYFYFFKCIYGSETFDFLGIKIAICQLHTDFIQIMLSGINIRITHCLCLMHLLCFCEFHHICIHTFYLIYHYYILGYDTVCSSLQINAVIIIFKCYPLPLPACSLHRLYGYQCHLNA